MTHSSLTLADRFAGLRLAVQADAARPGPALQGVILWVVLRLLGQLVALMEEWQARESAKGGRTHHLPRYPHPLQATRRNHPHARTPSSASRADTLRPYCAARAPPPYRAPASFRPSPRGRICLP